MATLLRTLIGFHWSYHLHGLFFSTIPHSVSSLKPSCFQPHGIVLHSDIITSCPEITEYFSGFFTPLCLLWYNARFHSWQFITLGAFTCCLVHLTLQQHMSGGQGMPYGTAYPQEQMQQLAFFRCTMNSLMNLTEEHFCPR